MLLRNNLHELFPAPEVFNKGHITLITLSYNVKSEEEKGAKNVRLFTNYFLRNTKKM